MTEKEKAKEFILENHLFIIRTHEITDAGFHRTVLKELVDDNFLLKFETGIYMLANALRDDMALLQKKYQKGVFSKDMALYLHDYSDSYPEKITMTFPRGYNNASFKKEKYMKPVWTSEKLYKLGLTQIDSPTGEKINVYDLERTLCDMVRDQNESVEYLVPALQNYFKSDEKDIKKLLYYARQLHVTDKIVKCMEVFS